MRYYSGDGQGHYGCFANVQYRKALLSTVILDEEDIVEDTIPDYYSKKLLAKFQNLKQNDGGKTFQVTRINEPTQDEKLQDEIAKRIRYSAAPGT